MQIEMQFAVNSVTQAPDPAQNTVVAEQSEPIWTNPNYRRCELVLHPIDDNELKRFGRGTPIKVTMEI